MIECTNARMYAPEYFNEREYNAFKNSEKNLVEAVKVFFENNNISENEVQKYENRPEALRDIMSFIRRIFMRSVSNDPTSLSIKKKINKKVNNVKQIDMRIPEKKKNQEKDLEVEK
ncbi:hypothetical protein [Holospora obtusa]|uniref:hypothetical protein n=1 Tax=Holospora obtusa TaxID=49893 RepID=UPI0012EB2B75|nr:hypothetical protein [Holospora obtusa]